MSGTVSIASIPNVIINIINPITLRTDPLDSATRVAGVGRTSFDRHIRVEISVGVTWGFQLWINR